MCGRTIARPRCSTRRTSTRPASTGRPADYAATIVATRVALDLGSDVRPQHSHEQAVVVRADDDQLGSAVASRAHERARRLARGPHVLAREARRLDPLAGLG